jgi:hypothetical protein
VTHGLPDRTIWSPYFNLTIEWGETSNTVIMMTNKEAIRKIDLSKIKLKVNIWIRRIFGVGAMVLRKNRILCENKRTRDNFQSIISDILAEKLSWTSPHIHTGWVKFFLHEYFHIVQLQKSPVGTRFRWLKSVFKSHDDKPLEVEADNFGEAYKQMKPSRLKTLLVDDDK